jgi:hypothetical protein
MPIKGSVVKRVDWTCAEYTKVFLERKRLGELASLPPHIKNQIDLWKEAQKVLPEDRWRSMSGSSVNRLVHEYKKRLDAGTLENLVPEPHDHRPASQRGFVKKESIPKELHDQFSTEGKKKYDVESPNIGAPSAPVTFDKKTSTSTPTISTETVQPPSDPVQMIATGLSILMGKAIEERLDVLVTKLVTAFDAKLNDQYIRILEYWDPEAAKQVREGKVELPPLQSFMPPAAPSPTEQQTAEVLPIKIAPPPKKKVLIVGGKNDGFWSYIQDCLPDCIIKFADGHKPRSIPTGAKFDFVLVHFMTSHSARAVINNYYPDHVFMAKGGRTEAIDIISARLGLQKVPTEKRRAA